MSLTRCAAQMLLGISWGYTAMAAVPEEAQFMLRWLVYIVTPSATALGMSTSHTFFIGEKAQMFRCLDCLHMFMHGYHVLTINNTIFSVHNNSSCSITDNYVYKCLCNGLLFLTYALMAHQCIYDAYEVHECVHIRDTRTVCWHSLCPVHPSLSAECRVV